MTAVPSQSFLVLQWRVLVIRRLLASRTYDTFRLRWRDARIEISETIDGDYHFEVNGRTQQGLHGSHLDEFEVDVLLAVWCAKDLTEAREHLTLQRLRARQSATEEDGPSRHGEPREHAAVGV